MRTRIRYSNSSKNNSLCKRLFIRTRQAGHHNLTPYIYIKLSFWSILLRSKYQKYWSTCAWIHYKLKKIWVENLYRNGSTQVKEESNATVGTRNYWKNTELGFDFLLVERPQVRSYSDRNKHKMSQFSFGIY